MNEKLKAAYEGFGGENIFDVPLQKLNHTVLDYLNMKKNTLVKPEFRLLGCMDDGVPGKSIGLGGPGIVLAYLAGKRQGKTGWQAVLDGFDTAALVLGGEIDAVSSHEGCGACGIIYGFLSGEEQQQFAHSDDLGITFAKELAGKLGAAYKHIPMDGMTRPQKVHTARLVFYAGPEQFNIDYCMPNGLAFIVSRGILEKLADKTFAAETGMFLLETACKIATGESGLGGLATAASPFVIVPVGGNKIPLPVLQKESREVAGKFPGNVAVLEGFTF
ncbi:MAG: hypothetical protein KAW12_23660 [Candidatus Aminicenantes bacterium]|nr:hypothetical protein [Candidatus Aminicenantes bacterium]